MIVYSSAMLRGVVIVLCVAAAGCLREPVFHGGNGDVPLDEIADVLEVRDAALGLAVSGPNFEVVFSNQGARYPVQLGIVDPRTKDLVTFSAAGATSCHSEQGTGIAMFPMQHANGVDAGPDISSVMLVPSLGATVTQVALDWKQARTGTCNISFAGHTTFTFFVDGQVVRHDQLSYTPTGTAQAMDCACDTSGQSVFAFTSYTTLSTAQLAHVRNASGAAVVAENPSTGVEIVDPSTSEGQRGAPGTRRVCAEGFGGLEIAFGFPDFPRLQRVTSQRDLAFVLDYLPSFPTTSPPMDTYESTTRMRFDNGPDTCDQLMRQLADYDDAAMLHVQTEGPEEDLRLGPDGIYRNMTPYPGRAALLTVATGGRIAAPFAVRLEFDGPREKYAVYRSGPQDGNSGRIQPDTSSVIVWFMEPLLDNQVITITAD